MCALQAIALVLGYKDEGKKKAGHQLRDVLDSRDPGLAIYITAFNDSHTTNEVLQMLEYWNQYPWEDYEPASQAG